MSNQSAAPISAAACRCGVRWNDACLLNLLLNGGDTRIDSFGSLQNLFHCQVRQVRGCDQRLVFVRRAGHDVDMSFQARTNTLLRTAESSASVQREMLRQHMQ